MKSIEKSSPHYFLDFLRSICILVENNIQSQLTQDSRLQERIKAVLHEISWIEWENKITAFVKPLSKILITLFYDKLLVSFQKEDYSNNLRIFLQHISYLVSTHKKGEIDSREAQNQFISMIENLWEVKTEQESMIPIMKNEFHFNKLLYLLFMNWECCSLSIELILKIKGETRGKNQLILPYIFDIGIPEGHKQSQGQIFTPIQVANFISKQNITKKTKRVIDPACGTGVFLLGALQVMLECKITLNNRIELIGIEKDPLLADITESAVQFFLLSKSISSIDWRLIKDDFFDCNEDSLEFPRKDSGTTTILMNPPYTRHEQISLDYKEFLKRKIEEDLNNISQRQIPARNPISGRSGLYIYFLIHATNFLREGDSVGLIIPNSWMDVDYGKSFQNFILNNYMIESIVSSRLKKLISDVDVNTAILKLKRKEEKTFQDINKDKSLVNFVSIGKKADLEQLANFDFFNLKTSSPEIRVVSIEHKDLYVKSKWSIFFRAPYDYFNLMEKLENKLIKLGEIACVRRGFTSGANEFFYVGKPGETNTFFTSDWDAKTGQLMLYLKDEVTIKEFKAQGFHKSEPMFFIEKEYWMHQIDDISEQISWQYFFTDVDGSHWIPNYLIKSPRDLRTYKIREQDIKYVVILIPNQASDNALKSGIQEYIRWGEEWIPAIGKKFNHRPTCSSRRKWYSLPSKEYKSFNLLCLMTINDRFPFFYNPHHFYFDARLYGIKFIQETDLFPFYFLFLNSFVTTLQIELLGRSNLGEGGLDIKVYEYELLKVPSYEFLKESHSQDVNHSFLQLLEYSPYSLIHGRPKEIKKLINDLIANLLLLSPILIDSLFNELKNLVKMRIEKAKD
ncbi:MAG: N-6 DNA methylase [Candidatus Heimdallarchaeota archaeon]|nr:MAG: N-6 DNA methylase [Candidatus Heimdallarchaeota archaeon]